MSIFTFFCHLETIRACVHPLVTTGFYMGIGRNKPWLGHSLTLMGQTNQTIKTPSLWTLFCLALASCYCLNLLTLKSLSLDMALGTLILVCALSENLYTAATTPCPEKRSTALTACTFLTLVAIMAQTATLAPTFCYTLAASLFSLIALQNLYTTYCFLYSLIGSRTPTKISSLPTHPPGSVQSKYLTSTAPKKKRDSTTPLKPLPKKPAP